MYLSIDMRPLLHDKFTRLGNNLNVELELPHTSIPKYPTVNLCEDNDMHFSSKPNIDSNEVGPESDYVLGNGVNGVESDDEIQVVHLESRNLKTSLVVSSCRKGKELAPLNVGEQLDDRWEVKFEDNMVPKEFVTNLGHNSSQEMWLGCDLPDCKVFSRTLSKFAIDNNFTVENLKTN